MKKTVYVTCPYCKHVNKILMKLPKYQTKRTIEYCDIMEGGCDKMFVVSLKLSVVAEALGIEGQGEE